LRRGLNARLPEEIRILEASEAAPGFHSRSDAVLKEYRYRLTRAEVVLPFEAPFVTPVHSRLDVPAMGRAAERLVGRHDFTSFCPAGCEQENRVRTVTLARLEERGDEILFTVRAGGFLRHMVRTIVGTLLAVGKGDLSPEDIGAILEARDRRAAGPCAPARGLTLVKVFYEGDGT
jgi:tRNA pseudouridine38-40 synthase